MQNKKTQILLLYKCMYTVRKAEIMKLRVKVKLDKGAKKPTYSKQGDSGMDLYALHDVLIKPGETAVIPTGVAFELPPDYEIQVRPRSGLTLKTKLRVQLGTVDNNYRGPVGIIVDNIGDEAYVIDKYDRLAQAVVVPVETANLVIVDKLSESERGSDGYGSTGVK